MKHPYTGLPDFQFWNNEAGISNGALLDPVTAPTFTISRQDRIVTAGSCFAQHVGHFLDGVGFNHYISEKAHPILPQTIARANHYGAFSARYGNIYTARQLRQLLDRAYGRFHPRQISWSSPDGPHFADPFRPQIQPGGFITEAELLLDRENHFSCVRRAFEKMNVFIFTLGLTEAWEDTDDGAIFPIAPGIRGGHFDPGEVKFRNFDESETFEDLKHALAFIRKINPCVRIILTVSPVPLNATHEHRHVLLSTTWSKAVLRIAAEKMIRTLGNCDYFPSYEIITSPHVRGNYYADDCREIRPGGVNHVMRLFLKHYAGILPDNAARKDKSPARNAASHDQKMANVMDLLCDEEAINNNLIS